MSITLADCKAAIDTALSALDLDRAADRFAAADLLLGTAIQESGLIHTRQMGGGPARGYWQMEPATHDDIWTNYLAYRPELATRLTSLMPSGTRPDPALLETIPTYAAAMARLKYRRAPEALPARGDLEGAARLWKAVYNTAGGAGTEQEFIENWTRICSA